MTGIEPLVRAAVRSLPPYRGLAGERPAVLLDGNENPLGPSPKVLEAMHRLGGHVLSRYPLPEELKRNWATYLGVAPENLVLTSGSGPAIALAAELTLSPGDTCLIAAPSFELYGWAAARREARLVAVPCSRRDQFAFPTAGFLRALTDPAARPKLVILGNPDNPTGRAPGRRVIDRMVRDNPETLFLVDEAYAEFYGSSVIPLAVGLPNVLVARTFSKALGLAGERIGGLIGDSRLIEMLHRINVPYPVTAAAVALGLAALEDRRHVRETVRLARRSVQRLARGLRRGGVSHLTTRANFVLADVGSLERAGAITATLARRGVAIRNRSHLPGMTGWIRISSGTDDEVDRFLEQMALITAPKPDALLFDMDGVLVDVRRSYDEAIFRTVQSFLPNGTTPSREQVLAVKNRPDANDDIDASCIALRRMGVKPRRAEVERRFNALYRGTRGKPGLRRLERWLLPSGHLRWLGERMSLGIVTGRPRDEARWALDRAGVGRWFSTVVTSDDSKKRKPDPEPVRLALRQLKVKNAWLIGDSTADLLAARRAGIATIAICGSDSLYGNQAHRSALLRTYGPMAVLASAADVRGVLEERERMARTMNGQEAG